jgi:hypothetical protein
MTQQPAPTAGETRSARRESLRAEIEQTRQGYHALLRSLTPEELRRTSGNPAWTVGQLMWHLAWNVGFVSGSVERARRGRNFSPPTWITDPLNAQMTRWGARRATKRSVAEKYDAGHVKVLAELDTIQDDEWDNGSRIFGRYRTVADHFHTVAEHFAEHSADIAKVRDATP